MDITKLVSDLQSAKSDADDKNAKVVDLNSKLSQATQDYNQAVAKAKDLKHQLMIELNSGVLEEKSNVTVSK